MKQELMDAIQEMPVIAAVKDDAGLCSALTNESRYLSVQLRPVSLVGNDHIVQDLLGDQQAGHGL